MRKSGQGGVTPFSIPTKPNVLTPLTNEELLERRGESALWYRLTPCPCPQEERLPDCKFCLEGQIRTFQETLTIQEEFAYKIQGSKIYTRFAPVTEVESAVLHSQDKQTPLTITHIQEESFDVLENLKYWNAVLLKYKVSLIEEKFFEVIGNNEYELFPDLKKEAIVGVVEVFKIPENENEPAIEVEFSGHSLNSIIFPKRVSGLHRIKIKTFNPVKIAYKTFRNDSDSRKLFERSQITFQEGELMGVMGSGYRMGEGDIITLLISTLRHSEFIAYQNTYYDRVSYSPIAYVDQILSKGKHGIKSHKRGEDFIIFGDSKIQWLSDKPKSGYTIIYDYHPTFRVTGFVEGGSGEDRDKPRIFKMKPLSNFNGRGSLE
ncbi:hypothetical protein LFX25_20580 [Leptospira sp. FAT2]|uniref:hypothetical protein n=1 Tax=Leptospira sanjuanensis TaxID=2879643 RepID=UPI001EE8670A|nr:hypothetical protein [Leptospira sanjuanensis]MCG6195642.1 hypothetical protein [Leptospira sanjuanensis]